MSTMIFTEIIGCEKIGKIALESYLKYHDQEIYVFCKPKDVREVRELIRGDKNEQIVPVVVSDSIANKFKRGHEGTAALMAAICKKDSNLIDYPTYTRIIRFDSDVYFKRESLSEIMNAFEEGYDIIGTRRCYGNNPGGVKGLERYPDTISTYFMGMNLQKLDGFTEGQLSKMWQGAWHPFGWPVLDFGDAVTHIMLSNGAKIKYLDWNKFGSQNVHGKKTNDYELNLHMDCGSHLIHMGGVGSGYSYFKNKSNPEKSYAEWALGRWALFAKVFYNEDIGYNEPTVYGNDGRWISGSYDDHILELFKKEIQ